MQYEVVEESGQWIVRIDGCELARFNNQDLALGHVAEQLRSADGSEPASLSLRYERKA